MTELETNRSRVSDERTIFIKYDPSDDEKKIDQRVYDFVERALDCLSKVGIELPNAGVVDILHISKYNPETKKRDPMGLGYVHFSHKMIFDLALGDLSDPILLALPEILPIGRYTIGRKRGKRRYRAYEVGPVSFSLEYPEYAENIDRDISKLFGVVPANVTTNDLLILFSFYSSEFTDTGSLEYPKIGMKYNQKSNTNLVFVQFNPDSHDALFARNMFRYRFIDAGWNGSDTNTSILLKFDFARYLN